jgi:hypothetical protein
MIQVYSPTKELLGSLTAYSELSKETGISETATLRFRVPLESAHLFKHEGIVQYKRGKEWIIKEILQDHEWFEVISKEYHPGLDAWIENQAWTTQTAKLMLTELLDGTGVSLDMPDYTEKRTITGSSLSKKELMFKVVDTFGLECYINDSNALVVRKILGEDRGAYATDELNLQSLVTAGDTYDFATRIEPRGRDGMTIAEVNGGLTYLDDNSYSDRVIPVYWEDNRYTDKMSLKADALKKLEVLAKPLISYKALILDLARGDEKSLFFYALGDAMTLLSSKTNERIHQRIFAIKEYPEEPWRNTATLANRPRTITNQEVENLKANYEWIKTSIEKLDDEIKLKVSSEEYELDKESNESRFTDMASEIVQNRESITSRVTKTQILTDSEIRDALKGDPGEPGQPGDPGPAGQTTYTWIRYADTPTSGMSISPLGKDYIGFAFNKEISIPSNNYLDYQWSLLKGEPGIKGDSLYTWIKYADDDKGSGMSDSADGKRWIGMAFNKESSIKSPSWQDYDWSPLYDYTMAISDTEPADPLSEQLWLDTSIDPNMIKRWTGTEWIEVANTDELQSIIDSKANAEDVNTQLANIVSSIQSSIASEIEQTNAAINFKFTETIDAVNEAGDRITDLSTKIDTNIRFTAQGMEIGKTENPVSLKIFPDRIAFWVAGTEKAYFTDGKLVVSQLHVTNSAQIGPMAWVVSDDQEYVDLRQVT